MAQLLVTLTPSESKRLIARALLNTQLISNALENGYLCITLGTTTAYLVEEILGEYDKAHHVAGVTIPRGLSVTKRETRATDAIFYRGEYIEGKKVIDVLDKMGPQDVIVKSANALDVNFTPIVLLASGTGGTVGTFLGAAAARNIKIVMPVGLEKCIPTVYREFASVIGMDSWDYAIGTPVGAIAVPEGLVFTEIEALDVMFSVLATPIAAGGVNGAEGSVTLLVEGEDEDVAAAYEYLKGIKGEPPFPEITDIREE